MRRLTVVILAAAALALSAIPANAQGQLIVTGQGPTQEGSRVELACPEHYWFHSGTATFYRSPNTRRPLGTVQLDHGEISGNYVLSGYAIAPKGARYYTAEANCYPIMVMADFSGRFEAAGEQATVLCPPETPYVWSASPISFFADSGDSYPLAETRVTNDAGQWVGVSFTASEPGVWRTTLHCSAVVHEP